MMQPEGGPAAALPPGRPGPRWLGAARRRRCFAGLRLRLAVILLAPILLASCGKAGNGPGGTTAEAGENAPRVEEAVPIECLLAVRGPISRHLATTSSLEATTRADVFMRASGIVKEVRVQEGDPVAAGQVIALLHEREAALAEEKARLQAGKLKGDLARKERMLQERLISQETCEEARHLWTQADLECRQARLQLENMAILSPITGTVTARNLRVGELATLNQKAFSVVDLTGLECVGFIPEKQISALRTGQEAQILPDALAGRVYSASILRISPVVDTASGTVKATLTVANADGGLRPGMFVKVNIVLDTRLDALLLPKKAVLYQDGVCGVFVVRDTDAEGNSRARWTPLQIGYTSPEQVEVAGGVAGDDRVVLVGQHGLKDGGKVRVVSSSK